MWPLAFLSDSNSCAFQGFPFRTRRGCSSGWRTWGGRTGPLLDTSTFATNISPRRASRCAGGSVTLTVTLCLQSSREPRWVEIKPFSLVYLKHYCCADEHDASAYRNGKQSITVRRSQNASEMKIPKAPQRQMMGQRPPTWEKCIRFAWLSWRPTH